MIQLVDLIYTLTSVIVRYHDLHVPEKLITESDSTALQKKALEYGAVIINDDATNYKDRLFELIQRCTGTYKDRAPLLAYFLHEIEFIKNAVERRNAFTPQELDQFKIEVAQLLLDLKQLLLHLKSSTYEVSYSKSPPKTEKKISLMGLLNTGYLGKVYCDSGALLLDVLFRFRIDPTTPDEKIRGIAEGLCMELQNSLLVPELILAQQQQHKRILELEQAMAALIAKNSAMTTNRAPLAGRPFYAPTTYNMFAHLATGKQHALTALAPEPDTANEEQRGGSPTSP